MLNETIIKCIKNEKYDISIMCMPDTYVSNLSLDLIENILVDKEYKIGAFLWNIRKTSLIYIRKWIYS